jgi:phospholipid transport system transporter-binding protein
MQKIMGHLKMSARALVNIQDNILTLSGILDHESVLAVNSQGQQWLREVNSTECILDLVGVSYSSSAGIALVLGWLRLAEQQQKSLRIGKAPANMAALAAVSGLGDLFRENDGVLL